MGRFEVVHHEEIDSELGDQHIKQRLTALKNSEARIIVLYSTTDRTRRIFQVCQFNISKDNYEIFILPILWVSYQQIIFGLARNQ